IRRLNPDQPLTKPARKGRRSGGIRAEYYLRVLETNVIRIVERDVVVQGKALDLDRSVGGTQSVQVDTVELDVLLIVAIVEYPAQRRHRWFQPDRFVVGRVPGSRIGSDTDLGV